MDWTFSVIAHALNVCLLILASKCMGRSPCDRLQPTGLGAFGDEQAYIFDLHGHIIVE